MFSNLKKLFYSVETLKKVVRGIPYLVFVGLCLARIYSYKGDCEEAIDDCTVIGFDEWKHKDTINLHMYLNNMYI